MLEIVLSILSLTLSDLSLSSSYRTLYPLCLPYLFLGDGKKGCSNQIWKEAKIKEMRALGKNDKAKLVHLPYGKKVDVNEFSQYNVDGSVER